MTRLNSHADSRHKLASTEASDESLENQKSDHQDFCRFRVFERFRVQRFHVLAAVSRVVWNPVGFSGRPSRPGPTMTTTVSPPIVGAERRRAEGTALQRRYGQT